MKTYRRVHKTARVPAFVVDGYRRCAFDGCRKVLLDEAHEARKYCNATCNERARRQRQVVSGKYCDHQAFSASNHCLTCGWAR